MRLESTSDEALAAMIGASIRSYRLRRNLKQDDLAEQIGVSKPTIVALEKGHAKLTVVIGALRALRQLGLLDALLSKPKPSPMQVLRMAGKQRLRASPSTLSKAQKRTAGGIVASLPNTKPKE